MLVSVPLVVVLTPLLLFVKLLSRRFFAKQQRR